MIELEDQKDGIVVTMVIHSDQLVVGQQVMIGFRVTNMNPNYKGAKVTIHYLDNAGNDKTLTVEVAGYGTSRSSEPIYVTVVKDFNPCFEITEVIPTTDVPTAKLTKITWGGQVIWQDGEQVAYPVIAIRHYIPIHVMGYDWRDLGSYVYNLPLIHLVVSEATAVQVDRIYLDLEYVIGCGSSPRTVYQASNRSVYLGRENTLGIGAEVFDIRFGEPGMAATVSTDVLVGGLGLSRWDSEKLLVVCTPDYKWYCDKYASSGYKTAIGTVEPDGWLSYSITLPNDYQALCVHLASCFDAPVEIYRNGEKIASGRTGSTIPQFDSFIYIDFRKGDTIKVRVKCNTMFLGIAAFRVNYPLTANNFCIEVEDSSIHIEKSFKFYATPEEFIDEVIERLSARGINAVRINPLKVVYR